MIYPQIIICLCQELIPLIPSSLKYHCLYFRGRKKGGGGLGYVGGVQLVCWPSALTHHKLHIELLRQPGRLVLQGPAHMPRTPAPVHGGKPRGWPHALVHRMWCRDMPHQPGSILSLQLSHMSRTASPNLADWCFRWYRHCHHHRHPHIWWGKYYCNSIKDWWCELLGLCY